MQDFFNSLEAFSTLSDDGILAVDQAGKIRWCNAQVEAMFGYTPEELQGNTIEILVPPHLREIHDHHRHGYQEHPMPRPMHAKQDLVGLHKSGEELPVEISLNHHSLDNEETVTVCTIRNVSELRRMELELKRRNDLLQTNLELVEEFQYLSDINARTYQGWQAYSIFMPCQGVSGDVFRLMQAKDQAVNLFLADVPGHAITAALLTLMVKVKIRDFLEAIPPTQLLENIHHMLQTIGTEHSTPASSIHIDPDGKLTAALAGHTPLIILPGDGSPVQLFESEGAALNVSDRPQFTQLEYQIRTGDTVFAYTDGLTEWANDQEEPFGKERLIATLEQYRSEPPETLIPALETTIETFANGNDSENDITAVALQKR